jgi:hypothetical protein
LSSPAGFPRHRRRFVSEAYQGSHVATSPSAPAARRRAAENPGPAPPRVKRHPCARLKRISRTRIGRFAR